MGSRDRFISNAEDKGAYCHQKVTSVTHCCHIGLLILSPFQVAKDWHLLGGSRMNTINQGPAHPLDRLSAYSGTIFLVSGTCAVARPSWAQGSALRASLWRRPLLIFSEPASKTGYKAATRPQHVRSRKPSSAHGGIHISVFKSSPRISLSCEINCRTRRRAMSANTTSAPACRWT